MPRPSVRGKLVDAGYETLFSQGFQGSSIQDITEAAGVPKGSFFNHFKTKEALVLEVLARYEEVGRGDLLFDETKPPLQRLRQHFEFLAERLEGWDFNRGCMIGNFATEMADAYPTIREALFDALTRWTDAVASVLRSAQAASEIDPRQDADLVARFLVNSWEGAVIRMRIVRNRQPLNEFFAICFGTLLK